MLESRGVEHHLRSVLLEHPQKAIPIADIGNYQMAGIEQGSTLELQLERMERGFVAVKQGQ